MNTLKLKLLLLLSAFFILSVMSNKAIYARDEISADTLKAWNINGFTTINFNQTSLSNWVRGGESSVAATGLFNLNANFNKNNFSWENTINLAYGLLTSEEYSFRKTDDKLEFNSKLGYESSVRDLFYTGIVNFKSQFTDGFNYPNDSVVVSAFFAPALIITSIGIDYKPSDNFSLYLSPVTGRYIIMNDQNLANQGAYGVNPAKYDEDGNMTEEGQKFKGEFGAYMTVELRFNVMENIVFKSKLDLFNNYTDEDKKNRQNIDVNFESSLIMKVNKLISANVFLHLLYDHEQKVPIYERINGDKIQVGESPKLQIKQILGIGLTYNFNVPS